MDEKYHKINLYVNIAMAALQTVQILSLIIILGVLCGYVGNINSNIEKSIDRFETSAGKVKDASENIEQIALSFNETTWEASNHMHDMSEYLGVMSTDMSKLTAVISNPNFTLCYY